MGLFFLIVNLKGYITVSLFPSLPVNHEDVEIYNGH